MHNRAHRALDGHHVSSHTSSSSLLYPRRLAGNDEVVSRELAVAIDYRKLRLAGH